MPRGEGAPPGRRPRLIALHRWLGRTGAAAGAARHARRCLVCDGIDSAEGRYLDALLALVDDPRFEDAFAQSDGLCVPHLTLLVDRGSGTDAVERLVSLAGARWRRLEAALERFIAKHDYRARGPYTDEEGRAWRLALEMLAGAPGVFGNARSVSPASGAPAARAVRRKRVVSRDGRG